MLCLLVPWSGFISLQRGASCGIGADPERTGIFRTQADPDTPKV